MKTVCVTFLLGSLLLTGFWGLSIADEVYLWATFDDKTIDAPIGTGGPDLGEPVAVHTSLSAMVRAAPFETACLELQTAEADQGGFAYFSLIGGGEVTTGIATVIVDLWFNEYESDRDFTLRVRSSDSMVTFVNLLFKGLGNIECDDQNHHHGVIGTYTTGNTFPLMIAFDMDAGTYSVWLDEGLAIADQAHDIAGYGVGKIEVGFGVNTPLDSSVSIDQIRVIDYIPSVPTVETSWGRIRALYR